jgi:hypothetical protein
MSYNIGPWSKRLDRYKCNSLFSLSVIDEENSCYNIDTWAQCYETFLQP